MHAMGWVWVGILALAGCSLARADEGNGFRASTGVYLGSPVGAAGGAGLLAPGAGVAGTEHNFSLAVHPHGPEPAVQGLARLPYLGLGYSASAPSGGWDFCADFGLLTLSPAAVRLGRPVGGGVGAEDLLRELRLAPLLRLGAAYSF